MKVLLFFLAVASLYSSTDYTTPRLYISRGTGSAGITVVYDPAGTSPLSLDFGTASVHYYGIAASSDGGTTLAALDGTNNKLELYNTYSTTNTPPALLATIDLSPATINVTSPFTVAFQQNNGVTPFPAYVITSLGLQKVTQTNGTYSSAYIGTFSNAKCVAVDSSDTTIYVGCSDGKVYIFDAVTSALKATIAFPLSVDTILPVSNGQAYAVHLPGAQFFPFSSDGTATLAYVQPQGVDVVRALIPYTYIDQNINVTLGLVHDASMTLNEIGEITLVSAPNVTYPVSGSLAGVLVPALATDPTRQNSYIGINTGCVQRYQRVGNNLNLVNACLITRDVFSLAMQPPLSFQTLNYTALGP